MSMYAKIAGVTMSNEDGSSRIDILAKCKAGEELQLIREPDNPYDKNAVKVCRMNGEQLGFIPKEIAESNIAPRLDKGWKVTAKIANITGGKTGFFRTITGTAKPRTGCNIEITG